MEANEENNVVSILPEYEEERAIINRVEVQVMVEIPIEEVMGLAKNVLGENVTEEATLNNAIEKKEQAMSEEHVFMKNTVPSDSSYRLSSKESADKDNGDREFSKSTSNNTDASVKEQRDPSGGMREDLIDEMDQLLEQVLEIGRQLHVEEEVNHVEYVEVGDPFAQPRQGIIRKRGN